MLTRENSVVQVTIQCQPLNTKKEKTAWKLGAKISTFSPSFTLSLICSCPQFAAQRGVLQTLLQCLGLPNQRLEDLLFPTGPDGTCRDVLRHLLSYLEAAGLTKQL